MTNQKSYVSNKKVLLVSQKHKFKFLFYKYGGEGGIRTHGTVAGTLVFKSSCFLVISIYLLSFKEQLYPKCTRFIKELNSINIYSILQVVIVSFKHSLISEHLFRTSKRPYSLGVKWIFFSIGKLKSYIYFFIFFGEISNVF